jgi:hypothetical protein
MATVTRRYRWVSSTDANLQKFADPSVIVLQEYVNAVDISIDDTIDGSTDALDQYMETLGYTWDQTAAAYKGDSVNLEPLPSFEMLTIGAAMAATPMKPTGSVTFGSVIVPRPGAIFSISGQLLLPCTAGQLTATFTVNGVEIPTAVLTFNAFIPQKSAVFVTGSFTSIDKLGFNVATNAGFLPVANALSLWCEVLWDSSPLAD